MDLLLNSTAEIQKYIKIDSTTKEITFLPYVNDAQDKYIRPVLGQDMLTELLAFALDGTIPEAADDPEETEDTETTEETNDPINPIATDKYNRLLDLVRNALAKFTFFLAAPNFDVKLTDSGFAVMMNANLAPASKDRVQALRSALELQGWDCVEPVLRYLESEKDFFTTWAASDAYTMQLKNFINSAEEFDQCVNIDNSRLRFKNLRMVMDNVEYLRIFPVISLELSDLIKTEIQGKSLTAANKKIAGLICRSVANYTIAYENDDINVRFEGLGDSFLAEVRKVIDAAPDDYSLYRDSDAYKPPVSYQQYENSADIGLFMFGN